MASVDTKRRSAPHKPLPPAAHSPINSNNNSTSNANHKSHTAAHSNHSNVDANDASDAKDMEDDEPFHDSKPMHKSTFVINEDAEAYDGDEFDDDEEYDGRHKGTMVRHPSVSHKGSVVVYDEHDNDDNDDEDEDEEDDALSRAIGLGVAVTRNRSTSHAKQPVPMVVDPFVSRQFSLSVGAGDDDDIRFSKSLDTHNLSTADADAEDTPTPPPAAASTASAAVNTKPTHQLIRHNIAPAKNDQSLHKMKKRINATKHVQTQSLMLSSTISTPEPLETLSDENDTMLFDVARLEIVDDDDDDHARIQSPPQQPTHMSVASLSSLTSRSQSQSQPKANAKKTKMQYKITPKSKLAHTKNNSNASNTLDSPSSSTKLSKHQRFKSQPPPPQKALPRAPKKALPALQKPKPKKTHKKPPMILVKAKPPMLSASQSARSTPVSSIAVSMVHQFRGAGADVVHDATPTALSPIATPPILSASLSANMFYSKTPDTTSTSMSNAHVSPFRYPPTKLQSLDSQATSTAPTTPNGTQLVELMDDEDEDGNPYSSLQFEHAVSEEEILVVSTKHDAIAKHRNAAHQSTPGFASNVLRQISMDDDDDKQRVTASSLANASKKRNSDKRRNLTQMQPFNMQSSPRSVQLNHYNPALVHSVLQKSKSAFAPQLAQPQKKPLRVHTAAAAAAADHPSNRRKQTNRGAINKVKQRMAKKIKAKHLSSAQTGQSQTPTVAGKGKLSKSKNGGGGSVLPTSITPTPSMSKSVDMFPETEPPGVYSHARAQSHTNHHSASALHTLTAIPPAVISNNYPYQKRLSKRQVRENIFDSTHKKQVKFDLPVMSLMARPKLQTSETEKKKPDEENSADSDNSDDSDSDSSTSSNSSSSDSASIDGNKAMSGVKRKSKFSIISPGRSAMSPRRMGRAAPPSLVPKMSLPEQAQSPSSVGLGKQSSIRSERSEPDEVVVMLLSPPAQDDEDEDDDGDADGRSEQKAKPAAEARTKNQRSIFNFGTNDVDQHTSKKFSGSYDKLRSQQRTKTPQFMPSQMQSLARNKIKPKALSKNARQQNERARIQTARFSNMNGGASKQAAVRPKMKSGAKGFSEKIPDHHHENGAGTKMSDRGGAHHPQHHSNASFSYNVWKRERMAEQQHQRAKHMDFIRGEIIGKGAFGTVYKGYDKADGKLIAIKEFRFTFKTKQKTLVEFEKETQIMKKLKHPNIVLFHHCKLDVDKRVIEMVMEFVNGNSIEAIYSKKGGFPESMIQKYVYQLVKGLHYAHAKNIIHRDIKGKNILIDNRGVVKIADFGSAILNEHDDTNQNAVDMEFESTPLWTAPEVLTSGQYDAKIDIWSTGCCIIEMATAQRPWHERNFKSSFQALFHIGNTEDTPQWPHSLSIQCQAFMKKCLNRDPLKRYDTTQLLQHPFLKLAKSRR